MKDIAKFAGTTLLLLLTLTLVSLVFIQSFMGDYEWLNIALTVVYSLAVLAAMVYDGLQRGTQDCKYAALMERQQRERGHEITAAERARMYRPAKGWAAGFLGMAPLLLIVRAGAAGARDAVRAHFAGRGAGHLPICGRPAALVLSGRAGGLRAVRGDRLHGRTQDVGAPGADDGKGQEGEAPPCRAQAEKKDRLGPKGACRKSPFFSAQKRAKKRGTAASSVE